MLTFVFALEKEADAKDAPALLLIFGYFAETE
jgi:hypothetical protein